MLTPDARVYVAGHRGMVGSAVTRQLEDLGFTDLVGWSSSEVNLLQRDATMDAVVSSRPDVAILAAARVGGIGANARHPVEFLNENLRIQTNLFEALFEAGTERVLFIGSSCIYPRDCPQPMREDYLMTGALEPTNASYALAKIAGLQAVQAYRQEFGKHWISAMPTNVYGPGDNFDLETAHALPALVRRLHEAREAGTASVTLWGSGTPRREWLHVDDLARACLHMLDVYDSDGHINVGVGEDLAIDDLAALVADVVGYEGDLEWDASKPDGMPRKLLDVSRIQALGWSARIDLREGIAGTYSWYQSHLP